MRFTSIPHDVLIQSNCCRGSVINGLPQCVLCVVWGSSELEECNQRTWFSSLSCLIQFLLPLYAHVNTEVGVEVCKEAVVQK